MNELFEIVEDLETIELHGTDNTAFEEIINKWINRKADAEADLERQYKLFEEEFSGS